MEKSNMTKEQKDIAKLYLAKEITTFLLANQDRIAREIKEKYGFNPEDFIKDRDNARNAPTTDSPAATADATASSSDAAKN